MIKTTAVSVPMESVEKLRAIKLETGVPIIMQLRDLIDDLFEEWSEDYYDDMD